MLKHAVAILTLLLAQPSAQMPVDGDWPMFRHDGAGTGRSPLTQISAANVATLASAWSYRLQTPDAGGRPLSSEATPIVVGGVMYMPAANRVVALEPETRKEIWQVRGDRRVPARRRMVAGRRCSSAAHHFCGGTAADRG